jgi:hypothetical protein
MRGKALGGCGTGLFGEDVDERLTLGEVLTSVDIGVVAPEDVLEGDVAGEVGRIAGQKQRAVVHRVDGHIATGDVVAQVAAGAQVVEQRRSLAGERELQVLQEVRRQIGRRKLPGAGGEVDILREVALRATS